MSTEWFIDRAYSVFDLSRLRWIYPDNRYWNIVANDGYEASLPPCGDYKELMVQDKHGRLVLLYDVEIRKSHPSSLVEIPSSLVEITFTLSKLKVFTPMEAAVHNLLK